MTEEEWLAATDPAVMGAFVRAKKRASARVLRLYLAAFWGWQSHRLATPDEREQLRARAAAVGTWAETGVAPAEAATATHLVFHSARARDAFDSTVRAPSGWRDGRPAVKRAVWLLREVFGNPFTTGRKRKGEPRRGWMFDPPTRLTASRSRPSSRPRADGGWRTETVRLLAQQIYDANDFSAMPILADALQDAGCDNDDILSHCRTQKEHVRGCWVLDLVLEKA